MITQDALKKISGLLNERRDVSNSLREVSDGTTGDVKEPTYIKINNNRNSFLMVDSVALKELLERQRDEIDEGLTSLGYDLESHTEN